MHMDPQPQSTKHIDELNKIRLALLGARCSVALIQKTCNRYKEILSEIGPQEEPEHLTIIFQDRVTQINESVSTAAGLQAPDIREQALESSFTELRMAIDHHLYTLDSNVRTSC
jgi:hypothetical protein